jgi:hypothetical protein
MQDTSTLIHQEFSSQRTFDAVVAAFETAIGRLSGRSTKLKEPAVNRIL